VHRACAVILVEPFGEKAAYRYFAFKGGVKGAVDLAKRSLANFLNEPNGPQVPSMGVGPPGVLGCLPSSLIERVDSSMLPLQKDT